MRIALLVLCLSSFLAAEAFAQAPPRTHTVTLDDYFTIDMAGGVAVSPDGAHVVTSVQRWDEESDGRNADLWVVDAATRALRRLTFDPAGDRAPVFGPEGSWIYFLSARKGEENAPRNGKTQVWRVSPLGGEEAAVTRLSESVDAFALSEDGQFLYYTVSEEQFDEDDFQSLRKEFKKLEYGRGVNDYSQLWRLDLTTWRSEKLIDEKRHINEFAVAPDRSRIALITRPDPSLLSNEGWSRVDLYDPATGRITPLDDRAWRAETEVPSPYGWLEGLTWSSDSRALAFRVDFDGYPGEIFTVHFGAGEPGIRKLTRPNEITAAGGLAWIPGTNDLSFLAEDHARIRVWRVNGVTASGQGRAMELTPGDVAVEAFAFTRSGREMAVLMPGLDHPGDLFLVRSPGAAAKYDRLTRFNPQVDAWKLPRLSIFRWTSPDGTPVEGILELPPDYEPGDGPLPLMVAIHGGPTASSSFAFRYWIYGRTYYAANGWALLDPNYRGSTGYGDTFLTDLIGRKNEVDVADILSGVDALIAAGIADSTRMAVQGWSNGGYLTNCIITRDTRFKAASSGAGVFDTVMQWSIEDTPGHVINFSGGLPWEKAGETMHRTSPLYDVENVTTPTLIHVGENDERVPAEHSRALFRALHHYLGVPSELVVYPGEGHGLTKYSHRKAKINWDQRWFEHYVLDQKTEALPGS